VERNFRIEQNISLLADDRRYDLHNSFSFEGVKITPHQVLLSFNPDPTWGVGQPPVILSFSGVKHLSLSDGFGTLPDLSDLDEVGYKDPADNDLDYIEYEEPSSPACHLMFRFGSDQVIRIWSQSVKLIAAHIVS